MIISEKEILRWLEAVKDPEIPVLSLVDLGVITGVDITGNNHVKVNMTPTFAGCPAISYMKKEVEDILRDHGIEDYQVEVSFKTQWNSNKISERGRKALKDFGLAPPPRHNLIVDLDILEHARCPYCNSENTVMSTPFGPTLCRSMHYCHDCHQAFEQFKPV